MEIIIEFSQILQSISSHSAQLYLKTTSGQHLPLLFLPHQPLTHAPFLHPLLPRTTLALAITTLPSPHFSSSTHTLFLYIHCSPRTAFTTVFTPIFRYTFAVVLSKRSK